MHRAAFDKTVATIIDMIKDAIARSADGERVNLYFHAGDGAGDIKTVGFYNTAGAGIILDRLCEDTQRGHTFAQCAQCDAVAIAIAEAQRAYRQILDCAGVKHRGSSCA